MSKEINEKTFELNITSELLNISNAYDWYLEYSPISVLLPEKVMSEFLKLNSFYASGLTQKDESSIGGGYDVSININNPTLEEKRLLILQFKSGTHRTYCQNKSSVFRCDNKYSTHIQFKFNDAADKTQHSILRNLANKPEIQQSSVMYVFPRVTKTSDLESKLGKLIWSTSFVPVVDIDLQASLQNPPLNIIDGVEHNYRTTYDGLISEVNYFYFSYKYNTSAVSEIIAEILCIKLERIFKKIDMIKLSDLENLINIISFRNEGFFENLFGVDIDYNLTLLILNDYLEGVKDMNTSQIGDFIKIRLPKINYKYTTRLPIEGLNVNLGDEPFEFNYLVL